MPDRPWRDRLLARLEESGRRHLDRMTPAERSEVVAASASWRATFRYAARKAVPGLIFGAIIGSLAGLAIALLWGAR